MKLYKIFLFICGFICALTCCAGPLLYQYAKANAATWMIEVNKHGEVTYPGLEVTTGFLMILLIVSSIFCFMGVADID